MNAVAEPNYGVPPTSELGFEPPPRKLRVLVFTTVFPNRARPLHGTFVLERIRHLASLADIHVVAPVPWHHLFRRQMANAEGAPAETTPPLAVTHPLFWYLPKFASCLHGLFLYFSTVREIARIRDKFDFDLIDAHFAYPDGFAAILLSRWFSRPVCITLRGTIVQWSRREVGRRLCDWTIRRAHRVIAVAQSLAERARQGGVPEDQIAVIANAVDSERFALMDRKMARRCLGLPEDERLLVSVGHISPRKGFHRVIRSLPRLVETCPDARLAIVGGKGAELDNSAELYALAEDLGLTDRVLFVGAQAPERVALWLGAADVFVLASDFEGCPNVVLEAMACGRPVVATKVGDVERMVPAFSGILLDNPDDAAGLADSLVAALARDWDARKIRDYVSTQSWVDVARQVATQWLLAIEAFRAEKAVGSPAFADDLS